MSAPNQTWPVWLDQRFWERLDRIELHHRRIQSEHETWRRSLDRFRDTQSSDLFIVWQRYCQVIAELELTTAQLEALRINPNGPNLSEGDHEAAVASRVR
jgi:hypothetical protein